MTSGKGTRLRSIPQDLDPRAVAAIDRRLREIANGHRVAIPLAIESGSRAWGFPSPDSDYDCRFVYVRTAGDYLSPWPRRDVIEVPIDEELDVNGWDLGKALKLLLKGNAVIVEWLMSPIVYDADPAFRDGLASFAARHACRENIARHYLHLGERQRRTYFADGKAVQLKKLFYALRPAAALRWLRIHSEATIAPMHFPSLMAECDPPDDVRALVAELIAKKAKTRELGTAPLPEPIERFVDAEFAVAHAMLPVRAARLDPEAKAEAEAFFRAAVARLRYGGFSTSPASGARTRE